MEKSRRDYSKMTIEERQHMVENLFVIYPRIRAILKKIAYCHQHATIAAEPDGMLLEGVAGTGKTTLGRYYSRAYPRKVTEEGTVAPILTTRVEVPASP